MSRTSVAWEELVTAATVGTGTRPLPHTGFHPTTVAAVADDSVEADGAARLLALAAMETAANVVTVQPTAATPVEPAPAGTPDRYDRPVGRPAAPGGPDGP